MSIKTLDDLSKRGYCIDEWKRWQQGGCLDYARGLLRLKPSLYFGTLYDNETVPQHHFVHDTKYAWDSAGRHILPYLGIDDCFDFIELYEDDDWYDDSIESDILAAIKHAIRNNILQ